jgi:ketosteroid isomerase-like protein
MKALVLGARLSLLGIVTLNAPSPAQPASPATASPATVAQSLLDTDRRFAAAASHTDMLAGLAAMFADGVVMPSAPAGLAVGRRAVLDAFATIPGVATSRVTWTPLRVGVSADGEHGFTFGFMTMTMADGTRTPLKYMAYWARESGAWRVIAYKRGRASGSPTDTTMMPPALPVRLVAAVRTGATLTELRHELMRAEGAFSAEAQRAGLGRAFAAFGSADAVNMGGAGTATYVVGAAAIAALVSGGDMTASRFHWGADTAFVASSGDLGITFGLIHANEPPTGADPAAGSPFFTIWRRADRRSPWRYVAE